MNQEMLTLSNICQGSAEEIFLRELQKVCENIADPNTNAKAARSIVLEFKIKPFEDRSGAQITFDCKSKVPGVATVGGQMFLARQGTKLIPINYDPRQSRLSFAPGPVPVEAPDKPKDVQ
jgi:hypothetical protein